MAAQRGGVGDDGARRGLVGEGHAVDGLPPVHHLPAELALAQLLVAIHRGGDDPQRQHHRAAGALRVGEGGGGSRAGGGAGGGGQSASLASSMRIRNPWLPGENKAAAAAEMAAHGSARMHAGKQRPPCRGPPLSSHLDDDGADLARPARCGLVGVAPGADLGPRLAGDVADGGARGACVAGGGAGGGEAGGGGRLASAQSEDHHHQQQQQV